MRAAIYRRVARVDEHTDKALDRQRAECEAYCAARGWDVVTVHTDTATSRSALHRLTASLDRDQIDVVVAYSLDRFARSLRDFHRLLEACHARRVSIHAAQNGDHQP